MSRQCFTILVWFVFGAAQLPYATIFAKENYLPPSIYRTLSTRHRSHFPQPANKALTISAHVAHTISLTPLVTLYYQIDSGDFRPKPMFPSNKNIYQTTIAAGEMDGNVLSYYFKVYDSKTTITAPAFNPEVNPYVIEINALIDTEAPATIELMPRTNKLAAIPQCKSENILFSAYVVEYSESPLDNVRIRYTIDSNSDELYDDMERRSDYQWNILIPEEVLSNVIKLNILGDDTTTMWPAVNDAPFTVRTDSSECSVISPFIRVAQETINLTTKADAEKLPSGEDIEIKAVVASTGALLQGGVNLYYKPSFMNDYVKTGFEQTKVSSIWSATIPADAVVEPMIRFYVELVQGKDEVTDPIWKERSLYYNIPIKASNVPPTIRPLAATIALSDTVQEAEKPLTIRAVITDTLGIDVHEARVSVRGGDSQEYQHLPMTAVQDSIWEAVIPATMVTPDSISYYIWASDSIDFSTAPKRDVVADSVYVIHINYFNRPPSITRTPETIALSDTAQLAWVDIEIAAFIVDTLGPDVESATLFYHSGGQDRTPIKMNNISDSTWGALIPANHVVPDSIYYYITATDGRDDSSDPNVANPQETPYSIPVYIPNEKPVIIHDPVNNALADSSIDIIATVFDTTYRVEWAYVHYKKMDGAEFEILPMITNVGHIYSAVIPAEDVVIKYVDYFISAKGDYGEEDTTKTPIYRVKVFPTYDVRPNPFTPNNDGFNDEVNFNISGIENRGEVIIYNRRGREIRTLLNGDPWDGRDADGKALPPDIYLYAVSINGSVEHSGVITLIR